MPVVEPGAGPDAQPPEIDPDVEATTRPPATRDATTTLIAASEQARKAGDHGLAISHIERAIRIDPNNSGLWSELALAYLGKGDSGRARGYASKALQLAGKRGDLKRKAWLAMADIEAFDGNLGKARQIRREYASGRG